MNRRKNKQSIAVITKFLPILILLGSLVAVYGVPRGSETPWNKGGGIGDVNLFTGTLNMEIPLIIVGGRGEMQVPIILRLTEKSWRKAMYYYYQPEMPASVSCYLGTMAEMFPQLACGGGSTNPNPHYRWIFPTYDSEINLGYNPGKLVGRTQIPQMKVCASCTGDETTCGVTNVKPAATRFTLTFYSPNGSSHELIDEATKGAFRYDTTTSCIRDAGTSSRGNVFISNDGSAMKFASDTVFSSFDPQTTDNYGNNSPIAVSGILYTANGSTYRIDNGNISWIKDRNGNKTTFTYYTSNQKLHTITDSLGRTVEIEYDVQDVSPYGLCDKITYKSFGGVDKITRVSKDNLQNVLDSGEAIKTAGQLFPASCGGQALGSCASNSVNPVVTSKLWLPDGRSYKFKYTSFVEISRVELPTGGAVEYDHQYSYPNVFNYEYFTLSREVTEKRIYSDSSNPNSLESKTKYSRTGTFTGCCAPYGYTTVTVDQTDPADNLLNRTVSRFHGYIQTKYQLGGELQFYITDWSFGREFEISYFANDGTTLGQRVLRKWQNRTLPWSTPQGDLPPPYDPRLTDEVFVTIENGKALAVLKRTEYDENGSSDQGYFSHLNIERSKAYNYKVIQDLNTAKTGSIETLAGMFAESGLVSISETDYLYDEGHKNRHILGLPSETRVMNPASPTQVLAKSQIVFDEQNQYYSMVDYGTTVGYEAPTGDYAHLRGNATTFQTWFAEENRWIKTHTQYDNFGNVRKIWDSSGDPNRFVETEYSSQHFYAYPTKKIAQAPGDGTHGTTENSTVTTNYDFYTGRVTSVTDANGQVTTMEYDNLLRPKKMTPPAGGGIAEKEYGDTPGNLFVKSRAQVDAQNWAETTAFMDNLGRVYKTQTKDLQGDIFSEIEYDSFGRVERVSNPYRQGEQKYWSKPRYDNANRVVETYAPAPDGQTGASMGTVEFGISTIPGLIGNYVTATDASGRKARSITNVFGQVVRVDEPTGNNDLGSLETPNQASYYTYNIKGELVKIQQGQQNRFFMYDSLGRLTRVRQPEQTPHASLATTGNPDNNQWTSGFSYDVFGNVISVTDAKGMVITNNYDKAGRIITSSYNDGITPQSNYYYDGTGLGLPQAPPFSKGSLTKISNGVSETRYTSFDNYGRVLAYQQITDGQTYNFGYKYDDKGNLIEETYPSGRVVKTHLDADGGLAAVSSKTAASAYKTYASNFSYAATGAVKAMMLGNGKWETAAYNERLQTTQIGLGNNSTDASLWKVNYDYGELNTDGTVDAAKNIGNVAKQTITVPTTSFVQTYKYDALNRLTEARETANTTGGNENWKQTFGYDRYGNRTAFYQKVGSAVLPIDNKTKPTVDPATNRFTTGQGYVYDFNGNLVQDAENRGFTYNGDDQQTVVRDLTIPAPPENPDANVIGRYYYDGEGKRVKKVTTTETVVFVYNAAGALAAEYSTATPPQNPTTSYLTTDNLGSPRVITDKQGNVISRRDFMPFGEEILAGVGARDAVNLKYSASGIDNIRQRFTGYEKDEETDLDFAEARMYKNSHGRFTAPDPLLASASLDNPQTFNRYVYVGNNPVNITDPSGLTWCMNGSGSVEWQGKRGSECKGGFTSVDGQAHLVRSGARRATNGVAGEGDVVRFNPEGTITILDPTNRADVADYARATGAEIRAQSNPVGLTTSSIISTAVSSQSLLSLPCPTGQDCGEVTQLPILPRGNLPLKSVEGIALLAEGCSMIPGIGAPCSLIAAIVRAGQGNASAAGENLIGAIPGGSIFNRARKSSNFVTLKSSPSLGDYNLAIGLQQNGGLQRFARATNSKTYVDFFGQGAKFDPEAFKDLAVGAKNIYINTGNGFSFRNFRQWVREGKPFRKKMVTNWEIDFVNKMHPNKIRYF